MPVPEPVSEPTSPDASQGGEPEAEADFQRGMALLAAAQYAQACACFEAAIDLRPEFPEAYYRLGLAHLNLSRLQDAADAFTMASCLSPAMANAYLGLAEVEWKQGRTRAALATVGRAVDLDTRNGESHKLQAALLAETGEVEGAIASYRRALDANPQDASAHASLGYLLFTGCEQYRSGVEHLERALAIDPNDLFARCNYVLVLLAYRGEVEQALQACDRLLAEQPDLHEVRLNRALALLTLGRFEAGWEDYEARKRVQGHYVPRAVHLPEWEGGDLSGKRMLVHGEQGLGDEIMFASCLGEVISRAQRCVIECSPRLLSLFARSFPKAEVQPYRAQSDPEPADGVDARIPAGSLPRFFRRSWADFPDHDGYLRPDPTLRERYRQRLADLGSGPKIGLSWQGGAVSTRRSLRSIPLVELAPLLAVDGCHFVDLQYGDTNAERSRLRQETGRALQHWPEAIEDLDQCAALVSNLDLVISVCTAAIHLTGALGRPGLCMVPANPEWRYLAFGEQMPWYPSIRLIRQKDAGDWRPVIEAVVRRLRAMAPR